jgi:transketolase N-terminal domain/subunit
MISDGEMSEGCIWEALRIINDFNLTNIKLLVNANGWGAYRPINTEELIPRFQAFGFAVSKVKDDVEEIKKSLKLKLEFPIVTFIKTNTDYKTLKGLDSHYGKI